MRLNSFVYLFSLIASLTVLSTQEASAWCVKKEMPTCEEECPGWSYCLETIIVEYTPKRVFGIPTIPNWTKTGKTCLCRWGGVYPVSELSGQLIPTDDRHHQPIGTISLDQYLNELLASADAEALEELAGASTKAN